jgi:hypothetical protein
VTGRYGCFGEKLLDDLGVKRTRSRTHSSGLVPRYSGFHADMSLSACALRRGAERHARRRYPRSQHRDIGRMAPGDGWSVVIRGVSFTVRPPTLNRGC